ncbi:recombinase family protein [Candidatus Peregrinibacteria bacterium]|nr:recombinase family protein [Candidatus Peregrinibacteria bacterium]
MSDLNKTTGKSRIAGYIRVSTNEQADKYGPTIQKNKIKDFIKSKEKGKGWVFDEKLLYVDDGYSGTLKSRPALDRLMRDMRNKKIDVVVVMKIDRLYRSTLGLLEVVKEMGDHEVGFISIDENLDTAISESAPMMERAQKEMMITLFGMLAQFERSLIISRTTEGKLAAAREGCYVGGNVPMGYDVKDKKLIINRGEEKWIRKIFAWFVSQNYTRGEIARKLTELKVAANIGKKLGGKRKVNPTTFWEVKYITTILRRTHYTGVYHYNKKGKDKDGKIVEKPRSEWIDFTCPPIIDNFTFKKAQVKLDSQKKQSNNKKTQYLLTGKIECAKCGAMFTAYTSSKKTKNYRCGKSSKLKTTQVCKVPHISENIIAEPVWEIVKMILQKPTSVLNKMERELKKESYYQALLDDKGILENRRVQLKNERQRVKEAFRRGVFTIDDLEEQISEIEKEGAEILEQLEGINSQLTVEEDKGEKIASLKEMAKKYRNNLTEPSYEDKYDLLQQIVKRILYDGTNVQIELRVPKTIRTELNSKNKLKPLLGGATRIRTGE